MLSRIYILILTILIPGQNILGQEKYKNLKNLKFKHLTTRNGLSQSSIIASCQDSKDYLWFGTRDGLNKFDGTDFTTFRPQETDNTSLTHGRITSIFEDSKKNLWVGTKKGLNKYNSEENNFTQYKESLPNHNIINNEIWDITQVDENTLWVGTNNGITKINLTDNNTTHLQKTKKTFNDNKIRGLFNTNDGNIWICTTERIEKYNKYNHTWEHFDYPNKNTTDVHVNYQATIIKDKKNMVWLGYEKGLAKYDEQSNSFIHHKVNNTSLVSSETRALCIDNDENLWVGTYKGLYILNPDRTKVRQFIHDNNRVKSLSQNSIYEILKDTKGDLWIGTWSGGINYFDHSSHNFKQLISGPSKSMLNYKVVSAIIEQPNEDLWIGTEGGGVNYYHKKSETFTYYTHDPKNKNSISSNNVKSMIRDYKGNLWIGTHDGGLNFLDTSKKTYKFIQHNKISNSNKEIKGYRIISLFEDINHNIWIGTFTGGLIKYDVKTKQFNQIEKKIKSVQYIGQALWNSNVLYIGGNHGLEEININTHKITPLPYSNTENGSSPVNYIYQGERRAVWIGTEGKGLYRYNRDTKEVLKFGRKEGLLNEVIYGILPDSNNNIWISTNNGISKLSTSSYIIENYDESDGLQDNEFNYGSCFAAKNGELYFGGAGGVNHFNPKDIKKNTFIPPVDLYSLEVNNKDKIVLTNKTSDITLKHNENLLTIKFTALSFSQANKNQYAYMLEGFDQDWNHIGNKKTATYTNLDKGKYVFRVKASNNDGVWNKEGKKITIIITPAPWDTWWAYLLYTIILFSILYFTQRIITIRTREKNELKQEKLDKEKLEEISQLKLSLFTNISHDFRTPLTLIIGPLERMIKNNVGGKQVHKQLQVMHRNANMLLELINQLLDFRKSENGKQVLSASKSDIVLFTENIKKAFDELAEFKEFEYDFFTTQKTLKVWFDQIKLKKILYNILSNAFKYNETNQKITIKISTEEHNDKKYAVIKTTSYGEIIPDEKLSKIFDRYYIFDKEGKQRGTGIGLALTKSLVELHHGKISATSSEEKGTCFKVMIPLGKKHLSKKERIQSKKDFVLENGKSFLLEKDLKILEEKSQQKDKNFNKKLDSILIVEDNIDVRNFIKDTFKNTYNIYEAVNGKEALDLISKNNIQLVISDVMMPEMNGFELCKRLKSNVKTNHIPIILLTAKTAPEHLKESYDIGADAYITKPFDGILLEIRVNNLLIARKNLISKIKTDKILEPKELEVNSPDEVFLKEAIKIIEKNISDNNFNVNEFTKQMHMSRSVLYRKTKAITGQSITEFIRTIKLKKAAQMISLTQMNISEIAYEIGFSDLKYFRKCFKKQFNTLPSNYRNQNSTQKK